MIDVWPVIVRGQVRANRARAVYKDGTLYVVHSANKIESYPSAEPTLTKDVWTADLTDGGQITFTKRGCSSCGFTLHKVPLSKIVGEG